MTRRKGGQVSLEYLLVMAFISFTLIVIIGTGFIFSSQIKDVIRSTQVNNFADKITSSSESIFYAGQPSRTTVRAYLPAGVEEVNVTSEGLIISYYFSNQLSKTIYPSEVNLSGTISSNPGTKKITIIAQDSFASISG